LTSALGLRSERVIADAEPRDRATDGGQASRHDHRDVEAVRHC
jgi:hypothetical protein